MAEWEYTGPHPVEDGGELVHPGDIREFDAPPDWGPWKPVQVTDDLRATEGLPGNSQAPDLNAIRADVARQQPVTPAPAAPAARPEGT